MADTPLDNMLFSVTLLPDDLTSLLAVVMVVPVEAREVGCCDEESSRNARRGITADFSSKSQLERLGLCPITFSLTLPVDPARVVGASSPFRAVLLSPEVRLSPSTCTRSFSRSPFLTPALLILHFHVPRMPSAQCAPTYCHTVPHTMLPTELLRTLPLEYDRANCKHAHLYTRKHSLTRKRGLGRRKPFIPPTKALQTHQWKAIELIANRHAHKTHIYKETITLTRKPGLHCSSCTLRLPNLSAHYTPPQCHT